MQTARHGWLWQPLLKQGVQRLVNDRTRNERVQCTFFEGDVDAHYATQSVATTGTRCGSEPLCETAVRRSVCGGLQSSRPDLTDSLVPDLS